MKYTLDELISYVQEEVRVRERAIKDLELDGSWIDDEDRNDLARMVAIAEHLIRAKNSPTTAL